MFFRNFGLKDLCTRTIFGVACEWLELSPCTKYCSDIVLTVFEKALRL